jgi:hypothetical protein
VSRLESEVTETYFGDVLQSWNNGVQLDLRVKLAIEFLKSGNTALKGDPGRDAEYALSLADLLITKAHSEGLIKDLPEDDELTQPMRRHIRRQMRAQIYGQVAGQKIASEEQPAVQPVAGRMPLHQ